MGHEVAAVLKKSAPHSKGLRTRLAVRDSYPDLVESTGSKAMRIPDPHSIDLKCVDLCMKGTI
jgi:hypothetical protein